MSHDAPPSPYQPAAPPPPQTSREKNKLGVIALILGVLAIFPLSILAGIPAIIVGFMGRKAVKQGKATNGGMNLAGIILGLISLPILIGCGSLIGGAANDASNSSSAPVVAEEPSAEPVPSEEPVEPAAPVETPAPAPEPTPAPEPEPTPEPEPEEATFGIGEPVEAGDFSYTVNGLECGVDNIGGEYGEDAQGQFCLVDMSVENISDSANTFFSQNVVMLNEARQEYSADDVAGVYVEGNDAFLSQINPGNTLEGVVVFDIPADQTPTSLQLSGGFFGEAQTVSLQ